MECFAAIPEDLPPLRRYPNNPELMDVVAGVEDPRGHGSLVRHPTIEIKQVGIRGREIDRGCSEGCRSGEREDGFGPSVLGSVGRWNRHRRGATLCRRSWL